MAKQLVSIVNLGCRVNRVESDRIMSELARDGFMLVEEERADLVVINTCAVTGEAEAKTRKAVRRALGLPKEPLVVVTGCVVNLFPEELTSLSDRVIAEPSKIDVPARVAELLSDDGDSGAGPALECCCGDGLSRLLGRSRLGVKIQDGCNHRCTYCIVWKARGPERSESVDSVLSQVREAVDAGVPEVVLTGVNLGAYSGEFRDGKVVDIAGLLDIVLEQTDIDHVRISSIEPMDVSMPLIERMAASPRRVAPFLHLPIQSGCTSTLRRMGRPYSAESLISLVGGIRSVLPDIALSCDFIVGFPGETDAEFEQSYALCEEIGFSRMHVFRYSKRPGTPAASMPGQVDPAVMAERSARMRSLADKMARLDGLSRIGSVERCVVEGDGYGTLGSFHRAIVDGQCGPVGSIVDLKLADLDASGAIRGVIQSVR